MALQRSAKAVDTPAADTGTAAPAPVQTHVMNSSDGARRGNTFGAGKSGASKAPNTYVKIRLSDDPSVPEDWFEQVNVDEQGIRRMECAKRGLVAFVNTKSVIVPIYPNDVANNYYNPTPGMKDVGVVARLYANMSKPSEKNPEGRIYLGGKLHKDGLVDELGQVKADSIQVFGNIVGAESEALSTTLRANAVRANEFRQRAAAEKTQQAAPAAQTPAQAAPVSTGPDLDFGI